MTLEIAVLFVILLAMAVMFFTELLPVDLTAFLGLLGLIYLGYLTPDEGFSGFSSPAVITMLSIFFLTGAIVNTGLGDMLATRLYKLVGGNELYMIMAIMLVGGILSAFIFNIAATAVLMPAVSSLARHSRISPSRLLMPLCFATVLGGTITMVGTPPNILAADILTKAGFESFSLFSFAPIGLTLLVVGMLYMLFIGRKGLPVRDLSSEFQQRGNLAQTYQLQENLFAIRVPEDSLLVGKSLRDTHLGISFGVHVLAVKRGSKQMTAPEPDFLIDANDLLMVQGNLGHLQELLRVQGVSLGSKDTSFLEETEALAVCLARLGPNHPWIGQSAYQLKLRTQYHLTLAAIRRKEEYIHDNFSREILKLGDELLLVGGPAEIKNLYSDPQLKIVGQHKTAMNYLRARTVALKVPAGSELDGLSLKESKLGQLVGVTVVAVNREGHLKLVQDASFQLQADDQLVVCGDLDKVRNLLDLGQISIETDVAQNQLMTDEVGMVEVTLAPRSRAAGKNLAELKFRDKFGVQVIGLWREGHALLSQFAYTPLKIGDAMLVQGSWQKIRLLGMDPDFVVLSTGAHAVRRPKKAGLAFLALLLMITLVLFG
ncbi:MAG: SLC13 family permease, partial [Acidobacteria bacterium]|nr:SLC13 family permease [Acidobacteriota bacterium]